MVHEQGKGKFGVTELSIGVSILVCLLLCRLLENVGFRLQSLAVCTAAVMCTQDSRAASWSAGFNRVLGVICGGVLGIAVIAVNNILTSPWLFCFLCGAGVIVTLLLCRIVKLPAVQGRVSCMSFLLIVLVLQGSARYGYALNRLIGTVLGAAIALLVSMLAARIAKSVGKETVK